uniref:Uncharacterized protein n=1 Tax=Oryza meridionalis TaxID=40149 RepID=A0A0E0DKQ1_9ORYZ
MAPSILLTAATGVEARGSWRSAGGRGGGGRRSWQSAGGHGGGGGCGQAPAVMEEAAGADERRQSPRRRRVLRPSGTSSFGQFCRMGLSRIWKEYSSLGTNPSHSPLNQTPLKVDSFHPIPPTKHYPRDGMGGPSSCNGNGTNSQAPFSLSDLSRC